MNTKPIVFRENVSDFNKKKIYTSFENLKKNKIHTEYENTFWIWVIFISEI
jgi:GH25 family lysozyme M1 (1,4-beta-N-acetylmuramidase)